MARIARIGTTVFPDRGPGGPDWGLHKGIELAHSAGQSRCDLLLLPEMFAGSDPADWEPARVARTREALQELADRYHMYILAGMPHWEGERHYNGAVLFDRSGQVAGVQKKIHLTEPEILKGVSAGNRAQPFHLDFGRVAALICFDIGWPAEWRALREQGAEIVCWLSAYDGGFPLQAYAWDHRYYVVSSVFGGEARFIDITGSIIGCTTHWHGLGIEEINLDRKLFHIELNVRHMNKVRQRYGDAVRIREFLHGGYLTLEPVDDRVDMAQLMKEFDLITFDDFHAWMTKMQDDARKPDPSL